MDVKQGIQPGDPFSVIERVGKVFVADRFSVICYGCGGQMAHGRMTLATSPHDAPMVRGQWYCQECRRKAEAAREATQARIVLTDATPVVMLSQVQA